MFYVILLASLGDDLLVPDAARKNGYKFFGATIMVLKAKKCES